VVLNDEDAWLIAAARQSMGDEPPDVAAARARIASRMAARTITRRRAVVTASLQHPHPHLHWQPPRCGPRTLVHPEPLGQHPEPRMDRRVPRHPSPVHRHRGWGSSQPDALPRPQHLRIRSSRSPSAAASAVGEGQAHKHGRGGPGAQSVVAQRSCLGDDAERSYGQRLDHRTGSSGDSDDSCVGSKRRGCRGLPSSPPSGGLVRARGRSATMEGHPTSTMSPHRSPIRSAARTPEHYRDSTLLRRVAYRQRTLGYRRSPARGESATGS
jgi:hypothetical protein